MSIASPPSSLTTVGVVTHPRRNCDEVFTAIVGWVRARGARLIALPEEAPAGVSLADQLPGEDFASTADLVIAAGGDGTILRARALAAPAGGNAGSTNACIRNRSAVSRSSAASFCRDIGTDADGMAPGARDTAAGLIAGTAR